MKKYLEITVEVIALITLLVSTSLNYYLLSRITTETHYKHQILELTDKKLSTSSMALETMYQDSINNVFQSWLEDGTSR